MPLIVSPDKPSSYERTTEICGGATSPLQARASQRLGLVRYFFFFFFSFSFFFVIGFDKPCCVK
jgi:hypothetical protein